MSVNTVTIPVKRPDGTVLKLTMPEFLEYKRSGILPGGEGIEDLGSSESVEGLEGSGGLESSEVNEKKEEKVEEVIEPSVKEPTEEKLDDVSTALVVEEHLELATTTPNTHVFEDEAAAQIAKEESVLETIPAELPKYEEDEESFGGPEGEEDLGGLEGEGSLESSEKLNEGENLESKVRDENLLEEETVEPASTALMVEEHLELATTTPNTHIFEDEAAAASTESVKTEVQEPVAPIQEQNKEVEVQQEVEPVTLIEEDVHTQESPQVEMVQEPIKEIEEEHEEVAVEEIKEVAPIAENHKDAWSQDDHKSLIEEELTSEDVVDTDTKKMIPHQRDAHVEMVLKNTNLELSDDLAERLRLLIQSRVKEIRDDEKVLEYCIRPAQNGGLGLSQEKAQELVLAIRDAMHLEPLMLHDAVNKLYQPVATKNPIKLDQKRRTHIPQPMPLVSGQKPVLHDITPGNPSAVQNRTIGASFETMGPIDEIARFTLVDLHRLGSDKQRVIELLKTKFIVLKEESFVLFLDAVQAWLHCPLYHQYEELIVLALNTKQTLNQVIQANDTELTISDVDIIVEINKIAQ